MILGSCHGGGTPSLLNCSCSGLLRPFRAPISPRCPPCFPSTVSSVKQPRIREIAALAPQAPLRKLILTGTWVSLRQSLSETEPIRLLGGETITPPVCLDFFTFRQVALRPVPQACLHTGCLSGKSRTAIQLFFLQVPHLLLLRGYMCSCLSP